MAPGPDLGATPSVDTGGRYDPVTDSWRSLSSDNVPASRGETMAVWTGQEMVVWGGNNTGDAGHMVLNTGAWYDPQADMWTALTLEEAPPARGNVKAVWTGQAALIFGGNDAANKNYNGNLCLVSWPSPKPDGDSRQHVHLCRHCDGQSPPHHQWRKDGVSLPDATDATLTIPNVQALDAGGYSVVVANFLGAVTSQVATLTVLVPSAISATHTNSSTGYLSPGTNTILCQLSYPAGRQLLSLLWRPVLPAGWTLLAAERGWIAGSSGRRHSVPGLAHAQSFDIHLHGSHSLRAERLPVDPRQRGIPARRHSRSSDNTRHA